MKKQKLNSEQKTNDAISQSFCQCNGMQSAIREFLLNKRWGGAVTETIADNFNLSNRQVGAIMGKLKKKGLVRTYTKGAVWIKSGIHSKAAPMRLSNSFYEWIGD